MQIALGGTPCHTIPTPNLNLRIIIIKKKEEKSKKAQKYIIIRGINSYSHHYNHQYNDDAIQSNNEIKTIISTNP